MADRFPLILNTSANQIQEIASGDTLDLSGNNIKGVGIITATNISGNIIAGAGTSNIIAGIVTAVTFKGDGDFVELDVDGHTNLDNVSIAGVVTATTFVGALTGNATSSDTVDITNSSSSGTTFFLTFVDNNGSGKTLNLDSGLTYVPSTNVLTAGTFSGSGSSLTGITNANISNSAAIAFSKLATGNLPSGITVSGSNIVAGAIHDSDINASAAIAGTKISPNFSGQNIVNTGTLSTGEATATKLTISGSTVPLIDFIDSNDNPDFSIRADVGSFRIKDTTSNVERFIINSDGHVDIAGNVDFGAGIDVTGNVIASGNVTAVDGTFSGNISIGGTLTYEDVTNIDSVGIVTAREGVFIPDNKELKIGNTAGSPDLKIYHDTSDSIIHQDGTGDLRIRSDNSIEFNTNGTQNAIWCDSGAAVKLYYNNGLKFKTTSIGAQIDTILTCYGAAGNPGRLRLQEGGALSEIMVARNSDTNSFLYFKTEISGSTDTRVMIDNSGHLRPGADSTYNLGTTTNRWANVYSDAINVVGAATINGAANAVNISHTSGHGLSITRSSKSFSINANWSAHDTHTAIEATSGMDIRFYLGGTEKIRLESAGNIVPTTDSQITLGNSSKRFTAVWSDYVEANNFGSLGQYSGKFGRIRVGADVYGNTIKTESDNNLNITVPHSVYFNTGANSNGSDAGTARLRIYDSGIVPSNDKQIDLGSTSIAWRNVYTDNIVTTTALSNRNVIHNGTMFVAQRGTSQSGVNSSGYVRTADRWKLEANGSNVGTYTVSRSTDNPGEFGYSFKIQCTTANSSLANNEMYEFVQYIEGRNVQRFNKGNSAAKPFALSFSVKTNKTGTYAVLLLDHQHSRMCCANYTVSNTGWNRYEIVFPADTSGAWSYSTDKRLSVKFCLLTGGLFQGGTLQTTWGAATNSNSRVGHNVNLADTVGNTFYITGVQLEAASACTPYEHKDYTEVVRECQRYLYTTPILGAGVWNGANSFFTACHVPVPMRIHPTVSTNSGNFTTINIEHEDNYGVTGFTQPSSGHGNPNSTAAQSYSGYSSFIIGLAVSYSQTTGYGGLVVCDASSDYFILDAQL